MRNNLHKAVFFDRDEVLNVDTGYPHRVDECQMISGADYALKMVNDCGYRAYIVTNQGGIGLELYTEADMDEFNKELQRQLGAQGGIISGIAFCPHHPNSPDARMRKCECRKPKPGMLFAIAKQYQVDLNESIMIGDRQTDIDAAETAGCTGYLFTGGDLFEFIQPVMDKLCHD